MIKTNCELPLQLLSKNEELNDIDFVLFHLYISNEKYKNYFLQLRKDHPERIMILDNSGYEFWVKGVELNLDDYAKVISELTPNYYLLPDKLMDCNSTLERSIEFLNKYKFNDSKPLAVIQGNSEVDMTYCLMKYYSMGIDNIAIPFHNTFFKNMKVDIEILKKFLKKYGYINEDILYATGRVQFVKNISKELEDASYVHFLGSHCPYEKIFYKQYNSMDTGYPVKCAICGAVLGKETAKPDKIIDEFFELNLDNTTEALININVNMFKKY